MLIHKLIIAIALLPATAAWALPDCESPKRERTDDVNSCAAWGFIDQPCKVGEIVVDEGIRAALLGVSTFNLTPVTSEVQMTWPQVSKDPDYARMPPSVDAIFHLAVRLDMMRRSVYVTKDGSSAYIVDISGPLQEIRWFGPLSWSEITQLCQKAASK